MSNSMRPHRQQPTRLPHPWDSPGKNTGVGCHFLIQCMKVKSESEVAQSCPTPSDPMDCSPPGSSVHGTFQARGDTGLGKHNLFDIGPHILDLTLYDWLRKTSRKLANMYISPQPHQHTHSHFFR